MSFFTLRSSSDEPVTIPLDPAIICQSAWLQAAVGIGEEEGVVPIASTQTLRCLVDYMKHHAAHLGEREVDLPLMCTCATSVAGFGYDARVMLPASDVAFLDDRLGAGESWTLESQESFLELLVAADYMGHHHLRNVCLAYFGCRLMSAIESDVLRWFGKEAESGEAESDVVWEECGEGKRFLRLSDKARLHVLREMRKIIDIED